MLTLRLRSFNKLAIVLAFVLLLCAFAATPAFADDETPPAPPEDGTTEVLDEGQTDVSAPIEESAPDITVPEENQLPALPEDTTIMVIGSDGGPLPLASVETVEILGYEGGDPIWCPSGVAPNPLIGGCSADYASIAALVASFTPTTAGTIWVEYGNQVAAATIDGGVGGNWEAGKNFSLTIQGGWNAVNGSPLLNPANPYSTFDTYLYIVSWVGPVTLKNVIFDSVTYDLAYDFRALEVVTNGNIVLNNVKILNTENINATVTNEGLGALLINTGGTGNVTVSNSTFGGNEDYGLNVFSHGVITLKNVFAAGNGADGAFLANNGAATAKSVNVINSGFSDNISDGLEVSSNGTITLNNISSTRNGGDGANLTNYYLLTVAAPVYVNGVNNFSWNGGDGLFVDSNGLIKVTRTTANNNFGSGVEVTNRFSPFSVGITISGFLNASNNADQGLEIYSTGAVLAAYLTTNENGAEGTYIDNTFWGTPKSVTISGTNVFRGNTYEGLEIQSRGTVLLNSLFASYNGFTDLAGVLIQNNYDVTKQMAVTLNGANTFWNNSLQGLYIESYGAVTLNNITAIGNGFGVADASGTGVYVANSGGTYAKPVLIKGVNVFNQNDNYGLTVNSDGAISVSKITASFNGGNGAWLTNGSSPVQSSVTILGYGVFESNGSAGTANQTGLLVESNGNITLNYISANYNYGTGVDLNTLGLTSTHAVTLNGVNNFNYNGDSGTESGLIVNADGIITVNNITASFNFYQGASLDNYTNWAVNSFLYFGSVRVNGYGWFIDNFNNTGLKVYTHGAATLTHVTSNSNGYRGIDVDADGNVLIVCAIANDNVGGFDLRALVGGSFTLRGLLSFSNFTSYTVVGTKTITTCP